MKSPDIFRRVRKVTENIVLLGATIAGLAGSSDVKPSAGWYYWLATDFNAQGCASVWVIQSHQSMPGERVELDIQPNKDDIVIYDVSGRPLTVSRQTVCTPGAGDISVSAERDLTP